MARPKPITVCTLDDCDNPFYGKGLCVKHYTRMRKYGDVNFTKKNVNAPEVCILDGCGGKHIARGYCKRHYYRLKRHGDPLVSHDSSGAGAPNWQGGRTVTGGGYVLLWIPPSHPMAQMSNSKQYVQEHRLVMAEAIGRPLERWETVHHIDGVKTNNDIANLQLRVGHHGAGVALTCHDCGSTNIEAVRLG